MHVVGGQIESSQTWLDRLALADINKDRRLDIIATEERQDWSLGAHLYLFEAPADPKSGTWVAPRDRPASVNKQHGCSRR